MISIHRLKLLHWTCHPKWQPEAESFGLWTNLLVSRSTTPQTYESRGFNLAQRGAQVLLGNMIVELLDIV